MRRLVAGLLLALLPSAAAAQQPAVRFEFPPPEIRIGEFRAALRVRLHVDARDFDPELGEDELLFRRARVVVAGRLYDDLEYELDGELRD